MVFQEVWRGENLTNAGEPDAVNLVILRSRGRLKVIQDPQGKDKARNWRDPSPDI